MTAACRTMNTMRPAYAMAYACPAMPSRRYEAVSLNVSIAIAAMLFFVAILAISFVSVLAVLIIVPVILVSLLAAVKIIPVPQWKPGRTA